MHLLQLERIDLRSTETRSLGKTRCGRQTPRPRVSGSLGRVVLGLLLLLLLLLLLRGKRRGSSSVEWLARGSGCMRGVSGGLCRELRLSTGRKILVHWTSSLLVWRISPVRLRI